MIKRRREWDGDHNKEIGKREIARRIEERGQRPRLTDAERHQQLQSQMVDGLMLLLAAVRGKKNEHKKIYLVLANDEGRMTRVSQLVLRRPHPRKSEVVLWDNADDGIMVEARRFLGAVEAESKRLHNDLLHHAVVELANQYGLQVPSIERT